MRFTLAFLFCGVMPVAAKAQAQPPILPRNDSIIAVAWAGSEYKIREGSAAWHSSLFVGVSGGHYWSTHLKSEIEIGWQTPANGQSYIPYHASQGPMFAGWTHRAHEVRFGATQLYQFGRNAWVHPFVGVGADVVRQRIEARPRQTQFVYSANRSTPEVIPDASTRETRARVQPHLRTGLKMYLSDRSFLTTELKLGFSSDLDHALWKLGLGFDF